MLPNCDKHVVEKTGSQLGRAFPSMRVKELHSTQVTRHLPGRREAASWRPGASLPNPRIAARFMSTAGGPNKLFPSSLRLSNTASPPGQPTRLQPFPGLC